MMKGHMKQLLSAALCLLMMLGIFTIAGFGGLKASAADQPPYCGIDVSKHNGEINWSTVKSRGVDFALLRCYALKKDETFDQNYFGATANRIAVGAYVFMYAENETEAREEAQGTLDALAGRFLDLPLFLDVEYKKVIALDKETVTNLMLIELEMFRAAGYKPGIYTSLSYIDTYMDSSRLRDYAWWVARWTREQPQTYTFQDEFFYSLKKPNCDVWQFSNAGDGSYFGMSSAYVDLDFCYIDYIARPEDPEQPVVPEDPDQPVTPDDPDQPVTPEDPVQPVTPEDPGQNELSFLEICFNLIKWFWNVAVMIYSFITASN